MQNRCVGVYMLALGGLPPGIFLGNQWLLVYSKIILPRSVGLNVVGFCWVQPQEPPTRKMPRPRCPSQPLVSGTRRSPERRPAAVVVGQSGTGLGQTEIITLFPVFTLEGCSTRLKCFLDNDVRVLLAMRMLCC